MSDVTGAVYEAFVGFLLHRLGYCDEWAAGVGRRYLFGKHAAATCHQGAAGCPNAGDCASFSRRHQMKFGPWYDPDFFVEDDGAPASCIHITHWSNPRSSQYKFWRTMEDHLQYKTLYGRHFLSVNAVFQATDAGKLPMRVVDTAEKLELHGWAPANGAVLSVSFDSTLLFPLDYEPLLSVQSYLPRSIPKEARKKREAWRDAFKAMVEVSPAIAAQLAHAATLLEQSLNAEPHVRYTSDAITALQQECWKGRQRAVGVSPTSSRYRQGTQHLFLLSEVVSLWTAGLVPPETVVRSVVGALPRFVQTELPRVVGLRPERVPAGASGLDALLASIPVRQVKGDYVPMLNLVAGCGNYDWNADLKQFIVAVRDLSIGARTALMAQLGDLFKEYREAYGMRFVLADLADPYRVQTKVHHVRDRLLSATTRPEFVSAFVSEMGADGEAPYAQVVEDCHNWPAELLLEAFDLGSMQHLATSLPAAFNAAVGHSLRPYAYMGDLGKVVSHLVAGVPMGQFFSGGATLSQNKFYAVIWPLFAGCLWDAIGDRVPLSDGALAAAYRYKKAMRIISSPDLEPVGFLFRQGLPQLADGPLLRGAFNQLSTSRGWGRAALTTVTAGRDPRSDATIHTQSVIGGKHIDDKTKELAARMRANHLRCGEDGRFVGESNPGEHYLVIDGDWPIDSKINLLEAGFTGIYELGDLQTLRHVLSASSGVPR